MSEPTCEWWLPGLGNSYYVGLVHGLAGFELYQIDWQTERKAIIVLADSDQIQKDSCQLAC